ncbi:ketopantoate reductase C-terminal domain-containing protein [Clostridium sp. DL1XJH146]
MQKDMKTGRKTEIDGLVFEMIKMANDLGVDAPVYSMIGKHFEYQGNKF